MSSETDNSKCGEDAGKWGSSHIVDGNVKQCSHSGKWFGVLKKFNRNLPYQPVILAPGHLYQRNENKYPHKDLHTNILCSFIHESQKLENTPNW